MTKSVEKYIDDYYLVSVLSRRTIFYLCDQLDGLQECIKDVVLKK